MVSWSSASWSLTTSVICIRCPASLSLAAVSQPLVTLTAATAAAHASRGGHVPAPAGRLDGDQAPDPSRPAVWLPSGESGMDAWVCWARRECLRASRHHAWTSSDSGTTPVYVCCRARPLTTVPESRAPGDHSGRLTATDKATRPSFPPGSHFGVQVFEKLSGRRDLNPRPLDPQECTPISATCLTSCFPQVKPPQVSRCQHRTALLSTGGSHCVPSPAETFALPGELVRHMRNAPGRAQEGLRGLASWLWLAVVVIVGAPHAGNTRVMARIAVPLRPCIGTVAMSQMVRVGAGAHCPLHPMCWLIWSAQAFSATIASGLSTSMTSSRTFVTCPGAAATRHSSPASVKMASV